MPTSPKPPPHWIFRLFRTLALLALVAAGFATAGIGLLSWGFYNAGQDHRREMEAQRQQESFPELLTPPSALRRRGLPLKKRPNYAKAFPVSAASWPPRPARPTPKPAPRCCKNPPPWRKPATGAPPTRPTARPTRPSA
ncbi:hypothetical protein GKZ68_03070 [Hymenobacter sp. BRD128]|uniref:hypothetical protein n=1 Tax=Hymenobacter sp. BRD128 TaxID=2675878 RepID=UPI001566E1BB|nr:hypothetical protein [Hymenobacter sp. BRD128]QKG55711.1 hypothetical protein GKZ68_03070 [Hymenobacter sp. BRD128]